MNYSKIGKTELIAALKKEQKVSAILAANKGAEILRDECRRLTAIVVELRQHVALLSSENEKMKRTLLSQAAKICQQEDTIRCLDNNLNPDAKITFTVSGYEASYTGDTNGR